MTPWDDRPDTKTAMANAKRQIVLGGVLSFGLLILIIFLLMRATSGGFGAGTFGTGFPVASGTGTTPGGNGAGGTLLLGGGTGTTTPSDGRSDAQWVFRQLTKVPVAGATTVMRSGTRVVRYVVAADGTIHDVDPETLADEAVVTGVGDADVTLKYGVAEAFFGADGRAVVYRWQQPFVSDPSLVGTVKTYLATITDNDPVARGTFLPDDILAVSVSPDGKELFSLVKDANKGSVGVVRAMGTRDASEKQVFASPLHEWLPTYFGSGRVALVTKPSTSVKGGAYLIKDASGKISRAFGGQLGLTASFSPDGSYAMFGEMVSGTLSGGVWDARGGLSGDEGVYEDTSSIGLSTMGDKCAWSPTRAVAYCAIVNSGSGSFPDVWYQGVQSLAGNQFYRIVPGGDAPVPIADSILSIHRTLDVEDPFVAPDEKMMFFIDKFDGTLWAMRLPG